MQELQLLLAKSVLVKRKHGPKDASRKPEGDADTSPE